MSEGMKVPYSEAKKIADDLLVLLGGHFERLETAGSLRRKKDLIGDIELVGIPKPVQVQGLFGTYEVPSIEPIVGLMGAFGYTVEKAGDKYLKFVAEHQMSVDLFICGPKTWGCIFMIRTGSAEFARKMVTKISRGGWCPNDMRFLDGRLLRDGNLLDTPEEIDVFRELGTAYVPPEQRSSNELPEL